MTRVDPLYLITWRDSRTGQVTCETTGRFARVEDFIALVKREATPSTAHLVPELRRLEPGWED